MRGRPSFRRWGVAAVLALGACAAGAVQSPAPASGGSDPEPPSASADRGREVARLVNAHRARIGCPALEWDALAAQAAQRHTDDMVRRSYFAHVSPEGQGPGERLRAQGAAWRAVAENIASGQETAAEVVRGWLASAGHRRNIEGCNYTRQGVGYARGRWTHVFYTPL
ncbi:MAG TPA: CAP domain-containing protein [Longimicrobiaceae bacterium]|nr:CAP domain-containing protein [Longimicrobiaceae bacterium]